MQEMQDDNILYLSENKKETKSWFQSLGTQKLPLGGNRFGFIRRISQPSDSVKRKFSTRNTVTEIEGRQYQEMVNHFGMTQNFDVAGYMLRNGAMLDFSGKHWGDVYSTFRQVDHRDIQEVLESKNNSGGQGYIQPISDAYKTVLLGGQP